MPLLDTLEKHFGRFAVPGLIRYIVGFNALVFLLGTIDPEYLGILVLDPNRVLAGEVWRLVTWIFIPNTFSFLWILFYLMFTWWLGDLLEGNWGAFRLNLYYFLGYLGCTLSAFFFGQAFANTALNASLLFAVATLAPNLEILLFLVLPVKIKWIALFSAAVFLLTAVSGSWAMRGAVIVTFANYLLFFGPVFFRSAVDGRQTAARRAKFDAAQHRAETLHRCSTCNRTEVSNPELNFRISAQDGHEYCTDHLPGR